MPGIVDLLFILSFPIAIVIIVALVAYFEYKKNMAMIEKGLMPDKIDNGIDNRLGWGIAIIGIGISLIIGKRFDLDNKVIAGLILLSIGIALLVSYTFKKKNGYE